MLSHGACQSQCAVSARVTGPKPYMRPTLHLQYLLPHSNIMFLFALPRRNASVMNAALAQHDRLVRATMAACCGYEVSRRRAVPAVPVAPVPYLTVP